MTYALLLEEVAAESGKSDFLAKIEAFLGNSIVSAVLRVIAAIAILIIGIKLIGWITKKLGKAKAFSKMSPDLRSFLHNVLRVVLYVMLVLSVVAMIGVPMASIIAVVSSVALAIGLALQGSLSNLAGGMMIAMFHPFRIGDYITTEDMTGTVTDLGLFYTTIETIDNRRILLPNANLSNNAIVNTTAKETRRLELNFPLMQEANFEQVKAILLPFGEQPETLHEPAEPEVVISSLTPLAMTVTLRFWCRTEDYWTLFYRVNPQAMKALNDANVPFAHAEPDYEIE
ncbi:MAG: mechanosensitive ion channel family protein [Clostridia bacterium]|nr:mechanosensitive ion channel family protein [Clostridia bacterium]